MDRQLTPAELVVLGLLVERPRHGYELDRVIEERGMREWTDVAFSSVYYLLGRLERQGLIHALPHGDARARRRTFAATRAGRAAARAATTSALRDAPPPHPAVLVGVANLPLLDNAEAVGALQDRAVRLAEECRRLSEHPRRSLPAPPFVAAIFDYALSALNAELEWVRRTISLLEDTGAQD